MGKKAGRWEKGPKHGWKISHKVRRDKRGEVVGESYFERSFAIFLLACPVTAILLWWWQAQASGGLRAAIVVLAILTTIYAVYVVSALVLDGLVSRFLERFLD